MDGPGLPLDVLLLAMLVVPCALALFFGSFAGRDLPPALFHCRRCDREFRRPAWKPFPPRCPRCRAADWNVP